MKSIISVFLIFIYTNVFCQEIPYKDGKIVYESIFEFTGQSKESLHSFSRIAIADAFVNANYVVQADDDSAGVIVGKGTTEYIRDFKNFLKLPRRFKFSIRIDSKDGRVRIRIYDIVYIDQLTNPRVNKEIPFELLEANERSRIGKSNKRLESYKEKSDSYNDHFYSIIVFIKRGIERSINGDNW